MTDRAVRRPCLAIGVSLAALLLFAGPVAAGEAIGLVKTLAGNATVNRDGAVQPLAAGAEVFSNDQVATSADGTVGITFRDDTTLSMGPKGRMTLDDFVFDPAGDHLKMGLHLLAGTFAMVSGQLVKLAPQNVLVSTPVMTIGIRGTSFLVEVQGDD